MNFEDPKHPVNLAFDAGRTLADEILTPIVDGIDEQSKEEAALSLAVSVFFSVLDHFDLSLTRAARRIQEDAEGTEFLEELIQAHGRYLH